MQEPMVSIVFPFKNTANFLKECIESIRSQSYQNWELIAVNDHSSDQSLSIATSFAQKDIRIHILENKGAGIIPALRTAYENSKGELITRMDSDDVMTANKLEVMVASLVKTGKGHLALGQVKYFSNRGISNGYERYEHWLNQLTKVGKNYSEIYKECVIPSPCWMVYREDLNTVAAFNSDRYPEDYDLAFRFYEKGLKCIPCNQVLHHWRDYDSRTSRTSEHYAQNYFLDIKVHYFLKLEYHTHRPLVIWGAGNKGKTVAKNLGERQMDFYWLCDNPNKIGKEIYGKQMQHFSALEQYENAQIIITVANADEQLIIRDYLNRLEKVAMTDYYFFC